jgi:hypothetical protein
MKANQDMERIYELLEVYDFNDLPENDRTFVLSFMTADEYINQRDTLKDSEILFSGAEGLELSPSVFDSLPILKQGENRIIRFLKKPVQLYKVAAAIILLTGLFSFIHITNLHEQKNNSLSNDTIYIYKTDTIYSRIVDTVRQIKEKVVYITQKKDPESASFLFMTAKNDFDSIQPNDLDRIRGLVIKDSVAKDTLINN